MRLLVASVLLAFVLPVAAAQADVRCVQEFLADTAFDPGPVDGMWGNRTATALEEFFTQIGEDVAGGLGRDNSGPVCDMLTGERAEQLAARGAYKIYPVLLTPEATGDVSGAPAFDFSRFELAVGTHLSCGFEITFRNIEEGHTHLAARGRLRIEDGSISFRDHEWLTGGLADASYLPERASLALTTDGKVVGVMPYFFTLFDPSWVAEPAIYVEMPGAHESRGAFPGGTTEFEIDGFEMGMFSVSDCSEASGESEEGPYYLAGYELAHDAWYACGFSINRYQIENDFYETDPMVMGQVRVEAGKLVFGWHIWFAGGLSNDTYLPAGADLWVTTEGQVVGRTPYFHLIVDPGEPPIEPIEVVLSSEFIPGSSYPLGVSVFPVDHWADGRFSLINCREAAPA